MAALLERIRLEKAKRTKNWQKIADYILKDPVQATSLKLKDFSRQAGVSEGSVINFARSLGYDGYIELKVGIAQANSDFSNRYAVSQSGHSIFLDIAEATEISLKATANVLDTEALERLAKRLCDTSGRVLVCGRSTSGDIARVLARYLMRLQVPAFYSDDCDLAIASLGTADTVIAITYSGCTAEIVDALRTAREQGTFTASVTAFEESKIAQLSDVCVSFASAESDNGDFPVVARIVQLAVCDTLCSMIYKIKGEQA